MFEGDNEYKDKRCKPNEDIKFLILGIVLGAIFTAIASRMFLC